MPPLLVVELLLVLGLDRVNRCRVLSPRLVEFNVSAPRPVAAE
jgi:hypothetical protein